MLTATVRVELQEKSYDIVIGKGVLASAGAHLAAVLPSRKVCVVTDEHVAKTHLLPFMQGLEASGFVACPPVILPPGEETKNFSQLQYIIEKCLSYKLDRKSTLIALGGGVVGDITGFAASVILRGINFVQIPTTLLSQVDSSVGGKTGINTQQGKNLVGAFYQPKIVLIDTDTLKTLPVREMKSGYAEILKYALINDPEFFDWLEVNGRAVLGGDPTALLYAIKRSCEAKADIVADDERDEKGLRELLNFGHTFGHAIEALGKYDGRILHGEAVGVGMKMAFGFSAGLGLCPVTEAERVARHIEKMGLMARPPFMTRAVDMIEKMRHDKKNQNGRITLILARGIGKAFTAPDVEEEQLLDYLQGAA